MCSPSFCLLCVQWDIMGRRFPIFSDKIEAGLLIAAARKKDDDDESLLCKRWMEVAIEWLLNTKEPLRSSSTSSKVMAKLAGIVTLVSPHSYSPCCCSYDDATSCVYLLLHNHSWIGFSRWCRCLSISFICHMPCLSRSCKGRVGVRVALYSFMRSNKSSHSTTYTIQIHRPDWMRRI